MRILKVCEHIVTVSINYLNCLEEALDQCEYEHNYCQNLLGAELIFLIRRSVSTQDFCEVYEAGYGIQEPCKQRSAQDVALVLCPKLVC